MCAEDSTETIRWPCQADSICIVATSYIGDIDQFSILRRSINLFEPGFPHRAIAQTEDCAKFRRRFRDEMQLEIIPTAEVLPATVERRRRKSDPMWFTGRTSAKALAFCSKGKPARIATAIKYGICFQLTRYLTVPQRCHLLIQRTRWTALRLHQCIHERVMYLAS